MIFAISLMQRRSDVSLEEFRRHWLDPHGPMTAKLPKARIYIQNHVLHDARTDASATALHIDGFAELGFDTLADRDMSYGSPELKACDQDSPLFIGAVSRAVTEAREVVPRAGRTAPIKRIALFTKQAGDVASQQARHEAALSRLPEVQGYVSHVVIRQGKAPGSAVPNFDIEIGGLIEMWFADDAAARGVEAAAAKAGIAVPTFAVVEHFFEPAA
jgi:uncharacterized protein (TIGR02118 family)